MKRTRLTSRVPLAPAWEELLSRVENATYRQGVKRLAHYCSAMGIPPDEVRSGHLLGLHEALEAECMTKHPRKVIKHTIAMWNHFGRTVPGLARGRARLALRVRAGHVSRSRGSRRASAPTWRAGSSGSASRTRSIPRRRSGR